MPNDRRFDAFNVRSLLVVCSFMVIRRTRAWQLYFTAFELIITLKFWKMNKKIIRDIFILKLPNSLLKMTER